MALLVAGHFAVDSDEVDSDESVIFKRFTGQYNFFKEERDMHGINYSAGFVNCERPEEASSTRSANEANRMSRSVQASSAQPTIPNGMQSFLGQHDEFVPFGQKIPDEGDKRQLMKKLARRLERKMHWPEKLKPYKKTFAHELDENPRLPAGYTYLLQFIAHDMVASSFSMSSKLGNSIEIENARTIPLSLATLYGSGPDTHPIPYEFSKQARTSRGEIPRTRLRTGRSRHNGTTSGCPFDDLGRGTAIDGADSGYRATEDDLRTEAFVADPRNDQHAIISQMVVLFNKFHNSLLSVLETQPPASSKAETSYRNFFCARALTTLVYRQIILYDVLERLLDPAIYAHYVKDRGELVNNFTGMPIEFAVGAFRCGHAMVRSSYQITKVDTHSTGAALKFSSLSVPKNLPMPSRWIVDWKNFFNLDGQAKNLSHRLGPTISSALASHEAFPALDGDRLAAGLAVRDLLSAAFSKIWSVPALISTLRCHQQLQGLLPEFSDYGEALTDWLGMRSTISTQNELDEDDIILLKEDPPLSFFVLFEAACTNPAASTPYDRFKNGGQTLGPLGSILVAETMLGGLKNTTNMDIFSPLSQQITNACDNLGVDASPFANISKLTTMNDLLSYLEEQSENGL